MYLKDNPITVNITLTIQERGVKLDAKKPKWTLPNTELPN